MLRKRFFFQPVVNFCQKICNMSSLKEKEVKTTTKPLISDGNMTKRSRKKVHFYFRARKSSSPDIKSRAITKGITNGSEHMFKRSSEMHIGSLFPVSCGDLAVSPLVRETSRNVWELSNLTWVKGHPWN